MTLHANYPRHEPSSSAVAKPNESGLQRDWRVGRGMAFEEKAEIVWDTQTVVIASAAGKTALAAAQSGKHFSRIGFAFPQTRSIVDMHGQMLGNHSCSKTWAQLLIQHESHSA